MKKTKIDEYLKAKTTTKSIRIKDGDSLLYVGAANDNDFIYILGEKGKLSKFAVSEITSTSKTTVGSKGINDAAIDALVAAKGEKIFSINKEGQAKLSNEDDYNLTAKGGNGQVIADDIISILGANKGFVVVFDGKKNVVVSLTGMAVKSKTSIGAKNY